jgi:hypothetical protein
MCTIRAIVALLSVAVSLYPLVGCSDKNGGTKPPPTTPSARNVVYIDSVDAIPGAKIKLNVHAVTESAIQGVDIPLRFHGSNIEIDSVSFVNTMLVGEALTEQISIDSSSKTVRVLKAYVPSEYLEPDSGVLMAIYVSIGSAASEQNIRVDTTTTLLPNGASASFLFSDTTSVPYPKTIIPEFRPGSIAVAD